MATYYDKREQREKTLPDCSHHSLTWDEQTQRCELMSNLRSNQIQRAGLGFLEWNPYDYAGGFIGSDEYWGSGDWWDYWAGSGGGGGGGDWWDYWANSGSGANDGPSDAWWDAFYGWLGAGFDTETAAAFADQDIGEVVLGIGSESCLERWSPGCESIDLPFADSPNWWDYPMEPGISPFPGYDPFDWGSYDVVPDSGQNLPGYCPGGTYHPYPIGHPQQDLCVPFPTDPAKRRQAQQQEQQRQQQQAAKKQQQSQLPQLPKCPTGQYYSTIQKKCVRIPQCPEGTKFDPRTEKCIKGQSIGDILAKAPPSMWLILLALLLATMAAGRSGGATETTITRRKK